MRPVTYELWMRADVFSKWSLFGEYSSLKAAKNRIREVKNGNLPVGTLFYLRKIEVLEKFAILKKPKLGS